MTVITKQVLNPLPHSSVVFVNTNYLYPPAHCQLIQGAFTEIINITRCMYTQNIYFVQNIQRTCISLTSTNFNKKVFPAFLFMQAPKKKGNIKTKSNIK